MTTADQPVAPAGRAAGRWVADLLRMLRLELAHLRLDALVLLGGRHLWESLLDDEDEAVEHASDEGSLIFAEAERGDAQYFRSMIDTAQAEYLRRHPEKG